MHDTTFGKKANVIIWTSWMKHECQIRNAMRIYVEIEDAPINCSSARQKDRKKASCLWHLFNNLRKLISQLGFNYDHFDKILQQIGVQQKSFCHWIKSTFTFRFPFPFHLESNRNETSSRQKRKYKNKYILFLLVGTIKHLFTALTTKCHTKNCFSPQYRPFLAWKRAKLRNDHVNI